MGGITSAEDALEYLLVGARAVAVGTATFTDPGTALRVVQGISDYLTRHNLASVDPLVGAFQA
jgi:dihydroorotate dehydrogenase (NAD+) catalytic subunit